MIAEFIQGTDGARALKIQAESQAEAMALELLFPGGNDDPIGCEMNYGNISTGGGWIKFYTVKQEADNA